MEELPEFVKAVIYVATCLHPDAQNKRYVGQTRTHILNHEVYRPFGAQKRWDQHVSEAKIDSPVRQSWKLNNAIRKYGAETFEVETLGICDLDEIDLFERSFIMAYDSINTGYNIQKGGRSGDKNSEEARAKTAITLKAHNDAERLAKYEGCKVIHVRFCRLEDKGVRVYVHEPDRVTYTSFYGRRSTMEESAARASAFVRSLVQGDLQKIHVPKSLKEVLKFDN
jgi:group I intron endonuclease